jgi:hypothetical protein
MKQHNLEYVHIVGLGHGRYIKPTKWGVKESKSGEGDYPKHYIRDNEGY